MLIVKCGDSQSYRWHRYFGQFHWGACRKRNLKSAVNRVWVLEYGLFCCTAPAKPSLLTALLYGISQLALAYKSLRVLNWCFCQSLANRLTKAFVLLRLAVAWACLNCCLWSQWTPKCKLLIALTISGFWEVSHHCSARRLCDANCSDSRAKQTLI